MALSAKPGVQGLGAGLQAGWAPPGWRALWLWVWLWALGTAVCGVCPQLGASGRGSAYGASRVVGGVSCTAGIRKLPSGAAQVPVSLFDLGQLLV